jgi:hypothetical protein
VLAGSWIMRIVPRKFLYLIKSWILLVLAEEPIILCKTK